MLLILYLHGLASWVCCFLKSLEWRWRGLFIREIFICFLYVFSGSFRLSKAENFEGCVDLFVRGFFVWYDLDFICESDNPGRLLLRWADCILMRAHYYGSTFWPSWSLPVSYFPWATNPKRESIWPYWRMDADLYDRSKFKYQLMTILLALAMVYMSFAAIKCAIKG